MDTCKICGNPAKKIFSKRVLKKYNANYLKCVSCSFVQTTEPVWIEEAYASAITSLDLGLLGRNVRFSEEVSAIIDACFPEAKLMLDYAGGYGVFVRLMRDRGYDFYRQDPYCENIFAKHFDVMDISVKKFDVLTAFEVFEHFVNPMEEIEKIFEYADTIIFSTVTTPQTNEEIENWWYISEETGQHVAFYSENTLKYIAGKFGKNYYGKNGNLHVFTTKKFNADQIDYAFKDLRVRARLKGLLKKKLDFHINRESLLEKDYQFVKQKINA